MAEVPFCDECGMRHLRGEHIPPSKLGFAAKRKYDDEDEEERSKRGKRGAKRGKGQGWRGRGRGRGAWRGRGRGRGYGAAAGSTRSLHRASTRARTRRRHAVRCAWPKRIWGRRTPRWMIAPNFFGKNAARKSWRTRLNSNVCEMIMRAEKPSWRSGRPHFSIY